MRKKGLWIALSVVLVLGLLISIFGCKATPGPGPTTAPTAPATTAAPSPTASPAPSPKPTTVVPAPAPTTAPAPAQPQVIKWVNQAQYTLAFDIPDRWKGSAMPISSVASAYLFAEYMKSITNGRLIIEHVPPGAIIPTADILGGIGKGVADCSIHAFAGSWTGIIPAADFEIGLSYIWDKNWMQWDFLKNWKGDAILDAEYAKHNVWRRTYAQGACYSYFTNFDPVSPAALKGKKFRSWGFNAEYLKAIGASPMTVLPAETYMALKLGTVDGALYSAEGAVRDKLIEVTKYVVSSPNTCPLGNTWLFNMDSIKKLPDDIEQIFYASVPHLIDTLAIYLPALDEYQLMRGIASGQWTDRKWSTADSLAATETSLKILDTVIAPKSASCKQLVDQIRAQLKELGKLK